MAAAFVDAVHYIAVLLVNDSLHDRAVSLARTLDGYEFVTTDAVLLEVLGHTSRLVPRARAEAAGFVDDLRADDATTIVPVTRELFDAGLALYRSRLDKEYSLADTIGMVICRDRGITDVLSYDRHFEQEGLRALLR